MARSNQRTTLPQSRPLGVPAPSEREPGRAAPFTRPPGNRKVSGDFHRPYETQKSLHFTIQRTTLPQLRIRSKAPSEMEPGTSCTLHPTAWKPQDFGRFSSPLRKLRRVYILPSTRLPGKRNVAGDFHRPYGTLNVLFFSFKLYYAIIIPQTPRMGICGISVFTTCLICTGGCVRLVRCLPFGPAGGLRYCRRLQWKIADCPLRRISLNQSLQALRC